MDPQVIISEFKNAITNFYGERLDKIILYGSRARGDYREDSDFDFAVVLKDTSIERSKEIGKLSDVVFPIELEHNVDISCVPVNDFLLNQPDKIFYYFLRTEGKTI